MKQVVFSVLAAGLVLGSGCSKKEEPVSKGVAPKAAVAGQTATNEMIQKAQAAAEQMTGKAVAVSTQTQAAVKEVAQKVQTATAQAQTAAKDAAQKAQMAVSSLTVKPADVLADLNLPVADIKTKAANYGKPELLAYANAYKDVIIAKKSQLAGLTDKLKGLGMTDLLGEKGKAIKDQLTQYTSQLSGLRERYGVYLDKLKTFGVDLSSFGI